MELKLLMGEIFIFKHSLVPPAKNYFESGGQEEKKTSQRWTKDPSSKGEEGARNVGTFSTGAPEDDEMEGGPRAHFGPMPYRRISSSSTDGLQDPSLVLQVILTRIGRATSSSSFVIIVPEPSPLCVTQCLAKPDYISLCGKQVRTEVIYRAAQRGCHIFPGKKRWKRKLTITCCRRVSECR
ncbi:unnamed protein product, partial [Nesidiocoris tenuis]